MTGVRVALVEDHGVLAEAMRISLTGSDFDVRVVELPEHAAASEEVVEAVRRMQADLVLLDLDLGSAGDGGALIARLREIGCRVLVLTANRDSLRWGECLANGALAVMSKSDHLATMVDTMLAVVRGRPAMPPDDRHRLIAHWRERSARREEHAALLARLSPRERQVLGGLVRGYRVREIAQQGYVSEATVRTQVKSILAKLHVSSQIAAIALAREAGMDTGHADGPALHGPLPEAR